MSDNIFQDKALQSYLKQIAKTEPLPREEEYELARRAQQGDKKAMDRLVEANLKFVVKIAAKYQNRGLSLSELISEGNIGLIKAIRKFDPQKDNKLISYAVWWIRQRILFALAEKTSIIRMPLGKANLVSKIKHAKDKVFSETGEEATTSDISDITNLDSKTINKARRQKIDTLSLDDSTHYHSYDRFTLSDILQDPTTTDPKSIYYRDKVKKRINKTIKSLPSREARIVKEYFGLEGKESKNFAQIGEELGLSRERVRQIQKKALQKIMKEAYDELENDIDYLIYNED